jgi:hypothetical protein
MSGISWLAVNKLCHIGHVPDVLTPPNVWRRAPVIRLLSSDAPLLPVCGAGVYTVLWLWTTLLYYLFELRFAAKWALQRSIWRWAWRRMWNVHDLEDSIDNLFQGAIAALTWSKWITISVSLTKWRGNTTDVCSDVTFEAQPGHCLVWQVFGVFSESLLKKRFTFPFDQVLCYALILPFTTIWSEILTFPIQHK